MRAGGYKPPSETNHTASPPPRLRKRVATQLAREGVSSLLPCYPVYGERRPAGQTQHLVATVAELGIASTAAAMEGAALVSWAAAQLPGVRCCITGMSMGGADPPLLLFLLSLPPPHPQAQPASPQKCRNVVCV